MRGLVWGLIIGSEPDAFVEPKIEGAWYSDVEPRILRVWYGELAHHWE